MIGRLVSSLHSPLISLAGHTVTAILPFRLAEKQNLRRMPAASCVKNAIFRYAVKEPHLKSSQFRHLRSPVFRTWRQNVHGDSLELKRVMRRKVQARSAADDASGHAGPAPNRTVKPSNTEVMKRLPIVLWVPNLVCYFRLSIVVCINLRVSHLKKNQYVCNACNADLRLRIY